MYYHSNRMCQNVSRRDWYFWKCSNSSRSVCQYDYCRLLKTRLTAVNNKQCPYYLVRWLERVIHNVTLPNEAAKLRQQIIRRREPDAVSLHAICNYRYIL